jgi:hypothetical protein
MLRTLLNRIGAPGAARWSSAVSAMQYAFFLG